MASTIKLKNGSGAPLAGDLVQGEPALDLTNKRLYTENASGTVIEVGTNPSTIDINAGTIDGTVIGGSSAAAGTFTTGQFNTSLNVDGTVTADGLSVDGGTIKLDGNYPVGTGNVALGDAALDDGSLSGAGNVAVGTSVLTANTTGGFNAAVGYVAMTANTTGGGNVAFGSGALDANTSGNNNVAVGADSLTTNTTASRNTAVGYQAGYSVTTNQFNAYFGYASGVGNTGDSNVGVGDNSLSASGGAAACVAVGQASLSSTTGNFNTAVGYNSGNAITSGTRNTIIGRFSGNQGGLDIRTASNYIVLSDGDGNPTIASFGQTEVLMRSGSGVWSLYSNGGGNNSTYNGTLIGANKSSLADQANSSLPSWFIDIGGRAADGATRPTTTADKFSVGRQAAGGSLVGAANLFEVNSNGAVGLNTTAASTGTGITFPATQSASSNANTLDDYEEGTWTPTLNATTTSPTVGYVTNDATYTKVGRLVTVNVRIITSSRSGGSGNLFVAGLPFAALSGLGDYSANIGFNYNWVSGENPEYALIQQNSSSILLYKDSKTNTQNESDDILASGNSYLYITATYFTA